MHFSLSLSLVKLEYENAADTPVKESLPTPHQLYRHGLEHLNLSIDYWQRALAIINLSLANSVLSTNQPDLIQHDESGSQTRLNDLKQKIEFLLNKIDVSSTANELQLILEQEEQTLSTRLTTTASIDPSTVVLNRGESIRIQHELQTVLSVQSDLNTFNDRRSLKSIRSTDSFESCPDVTKTSVIVQIKNYSFFSLLIRMQSGLMLVI